MKMMKKIAIGAVTLLSAFTLVACGNSKKDTSSTKEITVWGMGDNDNIKKFIPEFEKKTGVKVKTQVIPWANAHDKLLTAVASKSGPDVVQVGSTWMAEFQEAGALSDLSEYTKKYKGLAKENFFDANLKTAEFDGKLYGIPWTNDVRVLFYRKDILASVGYDKAPATWDELEDAAKKLTARGKGMYGMEINPFEQSLAFMFGDQAGSSLIENGKAQFNQPEFIKGVSFMNDFVQKGYTPKQALGADGTQTFGGKTPRIPMLISGPWQVKTFNGAGNDIPGNYATAVLPKGPKNNNSVVGGANLSIASWSKEKDASAQFIEFMTSKEQELKWYKEVNEMPTNKEALRDNTIVGDKLMKPFVDQLENAKPLPVVPAYEAIAQAYITYQQNIWLKGADVQKEMDNFNKKAQELLDAKK